MKNKFYNLEQCEVLSKIEQSLYTFIEDNDIGCDTELFTIWVNLYNHIVTNTDFEN